MTDKKPKLPASVWVAFGTRPWNQSKIALTADVRRATAIECAAGDYRGLSPYTAARYLLAPSKGKRRGR